MKVCTHIFDTIDTLDSFIAHHALNDYSTILIQCFDGTLNHDATRKVLTHLKHTFPHSTIIGASTDGEIIDGNTTKNLLVLSFSCFESVKLETYRADIHTKNSHTVGKEIGEYSKLASAKAVILFSDPLSSNGDEMMQSITSTQPTAIFAGGMAGDNAQFKQPYVILEEEIYFHSAVAVFITGDRLRAQSSYSFNWIPIGPEFTVTHSDGNHIHTLNDIPIVQIYREYLGDTIADNLPAVGVAFPLIYRDSSVTIGRAPMGKENDSLLFGGTIPQEITVQLGIANTNIMLESSMNIKRQIAENEPEAIFLYSCMARRRFLGDNTYKETLPLQEIAPVSGFFTYGEFYTDANEHICSLMNQTMSILTLSESPLSSSTTIETFESEDQNDWSILTFGALSHLINKTSIELQMLNSSLQRRIEQEITSNREKDKMMLSQAKRATMGEMISMIAHQWRQPIATIGLIADNLSIDVALDEVSNEKIISSTSMINDQVQYLSKTIDDFSNYFKPEESEERFTIGELFNELLAIIGKSLDHRGIKITSDFNPEDTMTTHRRELIQVCLNLINNSKDAITENSIPDGHIHFIHRCSEGKDQIWVSDNGGGIPETIKEKIFDPYFSTKTDKNGTGLGLYMSKTIAQKHLKGDLILVNAPTGATFVITISNTCEES